MRRRPFVIQSEAKNLGTIKKRFLKLIMMYILFLFTGCEHRELVDMTDSHYIRIYLDEHLRNVNFGFYDETKEKPEYKTPGVFRVTLNDAETGEFFSEHFLNDGGQDEYGKYIHGYIAARPGEYDLMAYNFDTESAHVRNEKSYENMEVYTNPIDESLKNRIQSVRGIEESRGEIIRYEPDHFFVTNIKGISLQTAPEIDTIRTSGGEFPVAESVVKTYYLQVNVRGVEYVRSAVALITGMAGSVKLHNRTMLSENPSTIYFNLKNGNGKLRSGDPITVGYANFNTFGKLPDVEGYIEITFEFHKTNNEVQTETIRVTDMFETEQVKEKQWIIIDKVITIEPPQGGGDEGGMTPGVNQWEEIESNITI